MLSKIMSSSGRVRSPSILGLRKLNLSMTFYVPKKWNLDMHELNEIKNEAHENS